MGRAIFYMRVKWVAECIACQFHISVWWMEAPSASAVLAADAVEVPAVEIQLEAADVITEAEVVAPAEPAGIGAVAEPDADAAAGGGYVAPEDDDNDPYCAICFGFDGTGARLAACVGWLAAVNDIVRAFFLARLFASLTVACL